MDLSKYRYRATFEASASITQISKDERQVATASLKPLKGLLPEGVDPESDPDLLYIVTNGATASLANRNDDSMGAETALAMYTSCKNKPINIEHNREDCCGVIIKPALSRFGTNEPIDEATAASLKEPFNISFVGVLWKIVNPMITGYIANQGSEPKERDFSMSWEVAFDQIAIGIGSRNLFEARVLESEDPSFATYEKMLRANGGEGKDPSGKDVYRIIRGDPILLGFGIVSKPAALVKGILPIEKLELAPAESLQNAPVESVQPAVPVVAQITQDQLDTIAKNVEKSVLESLQKSLHNEVASAQKTVAETVVSKKDQEKNEIISPASVTPNTASIMKIESIEQLESTLGKHEATAAVVDFVKAIKEASEQFSKDIQAKEDLLKNAQLAKEENEKRANELAASLAEVKKELSEIKAAQEAAEANQKFQDRMSSFDEKFDLDAEDRKLIASDIKDLDDAAFETYAAKCDKLMAAKKKKAADKGEKPGDKKNDKEPDQDADDKKAKAAAEAAAAEAAKVKEAVASLTEDKGQATLPNSVVVDEDLKTRMAAAFGDSILVNGKTLNQHKAAKAAKQNKENK